MNLRGIYSVSDARDRARRALPRALYDYVDGGAEDETTLRANRAAFEDLVLRPKSCVPVSTPDLSVLVLGRTLSSPVMLAPCGLISLIHRTGGVGVASAAARRGTVSVLSSLAGSTVEEVAAVAPNNAWFQLYHQGDKAIADALMERAHSVGVEVLVVTVDTAAYGKRERDLHHGITSSPTLTLRNSIHLGLGLVAHPSWSWSLGLTAYRLLASEATPEPGSPGLNTPSPFSWSDIRWLSDRWPGQLVVKGILTGSDARLAADNGASGVIVSNHGGRQLDGTIASFRALPEVVEAAGDSIEVYLDGGIRRGTHVLKALAVGARAVFVGRPYVWGLAVGGEAGVEHILDILDSELATALTLVGCRSVSEVGIEWISRQVSSR